MADIKLRQGAFVWRHGAGHEFFPDGALLTGEIVRINKQKRVAVIRSGRDRFTVNLEDLELSPSSASEFEAFT